MATKKHFFQEGATKKKNCWNTQTALNKIYTNSFVLNIIVITTKQGETIENTTLQFLPIKIFTTEYQGGKGSLVLNHWKKIMPKKITKNQSAMINCTI